MVRLGLEVREWFLVGDCLNNRSQEIIHFGCYSVETRFMVEFFNLWIKKEKGTTGA